MFRRILIWFGGMLGITLAAYLAMSAYVNPRHGANAELIRQLVDSQVSEAVRLYDQSGVSDLRDYLAHLDIYFPGQHHLLTSEGRDVVTGANLSKLLQETAGPPRVPLAKPGQVMLRQASTDGRFIFLVQMHVGVNPWQNIRVYGWIVLVVVLLCYVLAWRLVRPVRSLREVVVRFGQGDLASRTKEKRRDELGDLSRAFDEMADRIETLLTAERRLLQDISHELRSPLARLRFAVELARDSNGSPAAFNRIGKEVDRLSTLVDELLQVTRAEGDPGSRDMSVIELRGFLQTLIDDLRIESEARGLHLELVAPDAVNWKGDRELLHRAVENVVRNAIRHTEVDSAVTVELATDEPGWVTVRVRDHGPGVPEAELPRIFQPFYRVDSDRSRDSGGVGLGLAIATRAVRVHHGDIQARNAHPGLLVELKLPR